MDGQRVGTSVEWRDITDEVAVQEELKALTARLKAGDFSVRLKPKENIVMQQLVEAINVILNESLQLAQYSQSRLEQLARAEIIPNHEEVTDGVKAIQKTYNQCVDHLQDLVKEISSATHTLMTLSEELSQSQADLSDRSSKEAASLEEISANTEEIATTVLENSKHADETRAIAEDVRARLSTAAQSCSAVVDIIMAAARSAQETTDITKAIQDIAFTTNILSLNASVEAARAGEAGAGFSVVSNDIRNLGGRSSEAARNSQEMIDKTIQVVTSGGDDLRHTLKMFVEYGTVAFKITDVTKEAFKVAAEQRKGVVSINATMQRIREIAEENAHTAERCTEVAQVMETHAAALKNFIRELGSVVGHGVERSR